MRSQNTHEHFTGAILREHLQNSAVRQSCDTRFVRACAIEIHMDHLDWMLGLDMYRKNLSVWPQCLENKNTTNFWIGLIHQASRLNKQKWAAEKVGHRTCTDYDKNKTKDGSPYSFLGFYTVNIFLCQFASSKQRTLANTIQFPIHGAFLNI